MPGSVNGARQYAEIFEKRGARLVRVWIGTRWCETHRDGRGRIIYAKPERVSDAMKREAVPLLYKQIDADAFGWKR